MTKLRPRERESFAQILRATKLELRALNWLPSVFGVLFIYLFFFIKQPFWLSCWKEVVNHDIVVVALTSLGEQVQSVPFQERREALKLLVVCQEGRAVGSDFLGAPGQKAFSYADHVGLHCPVEFGIADLHLQKWPPVRVCPALL
jgi:hypothetical protein